MQSLISILFLISPRVSSPALGYMVCLVRTLPVDDNDRLKAARGVLASCPLALVLMGCSRWSCGETYVDMLPVVLCC